MMWIAALVEPDGNTKRGFVTTHDAMNVAVLCRRIDGEWLPEFAIQRDPELPQVDGHDGWRRIALPACFQLDPGAAEALEDASR